MQQRTAESGRAELTLGEEQGRRIGHGLQAAAGHLEDAEFAHRAEAVLDRPDHAVRVVALPFEVQHRVHHVLEHLGTGQAAVLGDVADQHRRQVLSLGGEEQLRGRLADLADRARGRRQLRGVHGLDRVDDQQRRFEPLDFVEDALGARLCQKIERRVADAETLAAALHLVLGLLARAVQDRPGALRELRRRLQQQRALADAGLATEEHEAAGNETAAEHPVELADARGDALGLLHVDIGIEPRLRAGTTETRPRPTGGQRRRRRLLGKRIPCPAIGAAPEPLGRLRTAVGAGEDGTWGGCDIRTILRIRRTLNVTTSPNAERTISASTISRRGASSAVAVTPCQLPRRNRGQNGGDLGRSRAQRSVNRGPRPVTAAGAPSSAPPATPCGDGDL